MSRSGGCQCGAVRYRIEGELGAASICHCRMCQKATGGFYGPFVTVKNGQLTWTRGERRRFQSSNKVWRGFCGDCGTPLTFEQVPGEIDVTIGSLDEPSGARPTLQLGSPRRVAYVDDLPGLPRREPDEPRIAAYQSDLVSYQHPDHDTDVWEPHVSR
jgi:hypothetical protein